MARYASGWTLSLLLAAGCQTTTAPADRANADAIRRLETRIAQIEKAAPPRRPPVQATGPATARITSLRAAADLIEMAEVARQRGEASRAWSLYEKAADEVGPDALVDVEPLYRGPAVPGVSEPPPAPAAASGDAPPAAHLASSAPRPSSASTAVVSSGHAGPAHDRASLVGGIRLEGPYASARGIGVVMLAPVDGRASPRPTHAQMEQRNKEFHPSVVAIPVGSTVSFPNTDPVFHNVFSLSPTQRFDLGLYKQGSKDVQFGKAGIVRVLCNLHAAMNAFIVVYDEPYAALTDRGGRFQLSGLPPGRYRVRIWHERARELLTREVTLEGGRNELFIGMRAHLSKDLGTDKDGKARGPKPQI